jgi:hypothetical protein
MKSKNEAREMREIIQKSLDGLPDIGVFGSNVEEKRWMQAAIDQLAGFEETGTLSSVNDSEVRTWLVGEGWSSLEDFL